MAELVEVRLARCLRPRPTRRVRVHRLRYDDLEPTEHVARVRLEDGHADAAHDAGLRPRDPRLRVLPAVLAMVQDRDSFGGGVQKLLEALATDLFWCEPFALSASLKQMKSPPRRK